MKYHLITYGCQMNVADSQEMAQPLIDRGFVATANPTEADVILMNTCTVRQQAEHRAKSNLGRLADWKKADPNRVLIVAGCAASGWGASIRKRYPYIDLVAPATRIEEFPELVAGVLKERWDGRKETQDHFDRAIGGSGDRENAALSAPSPQLPIPPSDLFGTDNTAYVTIMRGCNYSCSYCIVPQVRGREVYRGSDEILTDVRSKVSQGLSEVMLLGQTVNSYHYREPLNAAEIRKWDFADLLRAVNAVEGVQQIRFMSPHPRHMTDRVIDAMRDCLKVCRHIHLPVQSGSDRLLEHMKRLYSAADYADIVSKLRKAMPGILVTTDFIVGYPGETPADFEASLQLMRDIRFEGLFAFKFSRRPGTGAAAAADDVPEAEKENRLQRVLALNRSIQEELHRPCLA